MESADIADATGGSDRISDQIQPKMATERCRASSSLSTPDTCAACAGRHQYRNGQPIITLHMEACWARRSRSTPWRSGSPPLKMKLAGGVHGDIATDRRRQLLPKILRLRRDRTPCATCLCRHFS
jgi:hypothetical protein